MAHKPGVRTSICLSSHSAPHDEGTETSSHNEAWEMLHLTPRGRVFVSRIHIRDNTSSMHISFFKRAVVALASLSVATSAAISAEWTSFKVGTLDSFTLTYAHRPDGQFVLGTNGQVFIQGTFGSPGKTLVTKANDAAFDPSFIAIRSDTQGLIGAGGFGGPSGLLQFNPSDSGATITNTALATLQNYGAVFWKHPTSGREGWLIVGGNGTAGASNISFVSTDGTQVGAITDDLSSYSGGLAKDSAGNVFVVLADASPSESENVLKFTAAQIDAAVNGVITSTPVLATKVAATVVFKADASGSLAVDSDGRIWAAGYQIPWLQAYDPLTAVSRRFLPDHALLKNALSQPTYLVQTFTRNSEGFVSFLANDGFYTPGSDLAHGYKRDTQLIVRSVQMNVTAQTVAENAGDVLVTVSISPAPTTKVTVPVTYAGTATKGQDYNATTTSLVFNPAESNKTLLVKVLNDITDEPNDNETVIVRLGNPSPVAHAGLSSLGTETFTLTITDNDFKPLINASQSFPVSSRVGTSFNYTVQTTGGTTTKWSAKGLPPGLTIHPTTGVISGRPSAFGEFDQIVITATNAAGQSTSVVYQINIADFAPLAQGSFTGILNRDGTMNANETGGLGARVDLKVMSNAEYTGKIIIGKTSLPISGSLNTAPANPIGQSGFTYKGVNLTLDIVINATTGALTGTLTGGALLDGARLVTSTALTGLHNFSLIKSNPPTPAEPEGTGYGSITVQANGTVAVSGKAADGTAFTSSGFLGSNGHVFVYQALYIAPGTLNGTLNIASNEGHTVAGGLTWSKPTQTSGNVYRAGWASPIPLNADGGKYRPAAGATIVMNLPVGGNNTDLILQDGGLAALTSSPAAISFTVAAPALVTIAAPQKVSFNNAKGTFTGSATFGVGAAKRTFALQGLLVPDSSTAGDLYDAKGHGYFLLPESATVTRSGLVRIEAD